MKRLLIVGLLLIGGCLPIPDALTTSAWDYTDCVMLNGLPYLCVE